LNRAGVLLDTGPLVALLSKDDTNHGRAEQLFGSCQTPLRCPEAVLAEACFLMRKVDKAGPAEVLALGRKGVYELSISIEKHWANLEALLEKYADRPISLADACLLRSAEVHDEPRILTFDTDFLVYQWSRNKRFQLIDQAID
jgi:predicted nucleic acid-binding protein